MVKGDAQEQACVASTFCHQFEKTDEILLLADGDFVGEIGIESGIAWLVGNRRVSRSAVDVEKMAGQLTNIFHVRHGFLHNSFGFR